MENTVESKSYEIPKERLREMFADMRAALENGDKGFSKWWRTLDVGEQRYVFAFYGRVKEKYGARFAGEEEKLGKEDGI